MLKDSTIGTVSKIGKNLSVLTVGNIISMVIASIGFVAITHFLTDEEMGAYIAIPIFVTIFNFVTLNQMNKVVVREGTKNLKEMGKFIEKTIGIKMVAACCAILFCLISALISPYSYEWKLYVAIFSLFLIYSTFNGYFFSIFQAHEKMHFMAYLIVLQKVLHIGLTFLFLLLGYGLFALFIIYLVSSFIVLYINYRLARKMVNFRLFPGVYWDLKLIKPTIVLTMILFLGYLTYKIDIIMVSFMRPPGDVAIYGVAQRMVDPFWQFFNLVAIAIFPFFVKTYKKGRIKAIKLLQASLYLWIGVLICATL